MSDIQKSNRRKRVRLIGVRMTPLEYMTISKAVEERNTELIKAAFDNGVKPSSRALYTVQKYLMDCTLRRPPSPVMYRPAPIELAQLNQLVGALEKTGGLTKAFISGTGSHFGRRDTAKNNALVTTIEPTSEECISGQKLIGEMKALVSEVRRVMANLKSKYDGDLS